MSRQSFAACPEEAILKRVIKPHESNLPVTVARAILRFDFDQSDRDRMHELVVKNQSAILTEEEKAELDGYVHVGRLLDLLRSKARRSLKRSAVRSS